MLLGLIKFEFQGFWGLSMEQFTLVSSILIGLSICVPALLNQRNQLNNASIGPLDKGSLASTRSPSMVFEIAFGAFSTVSASLELIVREQVFLIDCLTPVLKSGI